MTIAAAKMPKRGEPYRLDQTGMVLDQKIEFLKLSDDLGWEDAHVSLAKLAPCKVVYQALPDLQLVMPLNRAEITVAMDGEERHLVVSANRLFIIAPDTPWSAKWRNNARVLNVFLKRRVLVESGYALFKRDGKFLEVVSAIGIDDRSITNLLHSLEEALYEPRGYANLKVEYILRALAADVLRKYTAPLHDGSIASDQLTPTQAKLVANHIRKHLPSKLLLKDLATLTHLGQTIFIRRFKASFGASPHQYVMGARISRARELLEQPDLSIAQVAKLCGFSDQSHLTVAFKRAMRMTPTGYRHASGVRPR